MYIVFRRHRREEVVWKRDTASGRAGEQTPVNSLGFQSLLHLSSVTPRPHLHHSYT